MKFTQPIHFIDIPYIIDKLNITPY